jgi:alkyl hydroperoxide reductase subunit AhpC
MPAYNSDLEKFAAFDAQVLGVSVDSLFSHVAWQKHEIGMLSYPLCSDFYPHGEVAGQFGVLRLGDPIPGISDRAIFIVDKEGKIAFSRVYPLNATPENEELFEVLREMNAVTRR